MIIGLNLVEDNLDELLKRFKMMKNAQVEIGVFTAGDHYSNFTYPKLLKYLSDGNPEMNLPPRPVLQVAMTFNYTKGLKVNKKYLKKFLSKINTKKTEQEFLDYLNHLGSYYSTATKQIFGDTNMLIKNSKWTVKQKGFDAPLVRKGLLKEAITYRISE